MTLYAKWWTLALLRLAGDSTVRVGLSDVRVGLSDPLATVTFALAFAFALALTHRHWRAPGSEKH